MKDKNQNFVKCSNRLNVEAWLKSALVALAIGFFVAFVLSTVAWMTEYNGLWICIGVFAGISLAAMPIIYFSAFRPTVQKNAKRIDRLGLEERTITMLEFKNDESYIARLQREDAEAHLASLDAQALKIKVPKKITIPFIASAVLGIGMTTLSVLAALGIVWSGIELLDPIIPDGPIEYVIVEYVAEEGGYINGSELQEVIVGETASEVIAVPEDGWVFVGWDDGVKSISREDSGLRHDKTVFAIFAQLGDGEGPPGAPGEDPGPGAPGDDGDPGQGGDKGEEGENGDAGGKYNPANMIINSETNYSDVSDDYRAEAESEMSESGEAFPSESKDVVDGYYDIIG